MSLNTNGWDYGYHLNLEKVNKMILDNAAKDKTDVENFINSLNFPVSNNAITNITSLNSPRSRANPFAWHLINKKAFNIFDKKKK